MPEPLAERERLRLLAHQLRCARGLSFRQVQAVMREEYGARRSLGQIYADLTRFACERCEGGPP
jgi:hypothetical protein